jgi:hypothetical protein
MTPQRFLEGLQADMRDIEAAPPDVRAMRRTFTVERILSGGVVPDALSRVQTSMPDMAQSARTEHCWCKQCGFCFCDTAHGQCHQHPALTYHTSLLLTQVGGEGDLQALVREAQLELGSTGLPVVGVGGVTQALLAGSLQNPPPLGQGSMSMGGAGATPATPPAGAASQAGGADEPDAKRQRMSPLPAGMGGPILQNIVRQQQQQQQGQGQTGQGQLTAQQEIAALEQDNAALQAFLDAVLGSVDAIQQVRSSPAILRLHLPVVVGAAAQEKTRRGSCSWDQASYLSTTSAVVGAAIQERVWLTHPYYTGRPPVVSNTPAISPLTNPLSARGGLLYHVMYVIIISAHILAPPPCRAGEPADETAAAGDVSPPWHRSRPSKAQPDDSSPPAPTPPRHSSNPHRSTRFA